MNIAKILVDSPKWLYSKWDVDWALKQVLVKDLSQCGVKSPDGILYIVVYNVFRFAGRFVPKSFRPSYMRMFANMRARFLAGKGVEIVISQGAYPPVSSKYKLIWETYFLPPQAGSSVYTEPFVRGGKNFWMKQMEEYGSKVYKIGVRGRASVGYVKKLFPEYAGKVVDLPYIHHIKCEITEEEIVRKQSEKNVEILFVGREAKRKGLDLLIEAAKLLRDEGVKDFHLTIVSALRDGRIEIPDEDWVSYYGEMDHQEALKLFKRVQIFAMPSRFETYGMVYLEALANGCVTCVKDGDPQREFVDDGAAGVCLDCTSPQKMAESLRPLVTDSNQRIKLSLAGVEWYRRNFSSEVVHSKWVECIR